MDELPELDASTMYQGLWESVSGGVDDGDHEEVLDRESQGSIMRALITGTEWSQDNPPYSWRKETLPGLCSTTLLKTGNCAQQFQVLFQHCEGSANLNMLYGRVTLNFLSILAVFGDPDVVLLALERVGEDRVQWAIRSYILPWAVRADSVAVLDACLGLYNFGLARLPRQARALYRRRCIAYLHDRQIAVEAARPDEEAAASGKHKRRRVAAANPGLGNAAPDAPIVVERRVPSLLSLAADTIADQLSASPSRATELATRQVGWDCMQHVVAQVKQRMDATRVLSYLYHNEHMRSIGAVTTAHMVEAAQHEMRSYGSSMWLDSMAEGWELPLWQPYTQPGHMDHFVRQPADDPYWGTVVRHAVTGGKQPDAIPDVPTGERCIVDRDTFVRQFDAFTGGVLRGFDWRNVMVVGSAVAACLQPLPSGTDPATWYAEHMPKSDIDLCIYGLNTQRLDAELSEFSARLAEVVTFFEDRAPECVILGTAATWTIVTPWPRRHIQILLGRWPTPEAVLASTDIDITGVGFTGGNLFITSRAQLALEHRHSWVDPHHSWLMRGEPYYESRLVKYARRGFAVADPEVTPELASACVDEMRAKVEAGEELVLHHVDQSYDPNTGELYTDRILGLQLITLAVHWPQVAESLWAADAAGTGIPLGPGVTVQDVRQAMEAQEYIPADGYGQEEEGYLVLNSPDEREQCLSHMWIACTETQRYSQRMDFPRYWHPSMDPDADDDDDE